MSWEGTMEYNRFPSAKLRLFKLHTSSWIYNGYQRKAMYYSGGKYLRKGDVLLGR